MLCSYLEAIILHCLYKINEERTVYSVYHLINGKKSSQTIQDSHIYKISQYFRVYPMLTRDKFQQVLTHLDEEGLLLFIDREKGTYKCTVKGKEALQIVEMTHRKLPNINGIQYHMLAPLFWRRFSLLFQVLSNAVYNNSRYYCVQRDLAIQNWVKVYLSQNNKKKTLAKAVHDELHRLLSELPNKQAQIFMLKLTGYERIGYSDRQIAECLQLNEEDIYFYFIDTLHFLLNSVKQLRNDFSTLYSVFHDIQENHALPVTQSSLITLGYLRQGLTIDEISAARNLKNNTIEDHIVELVLYTNEVDLSSYVSDALVKDIIQAAIKSKT